MPSLTGIISEQPGAIEVCVIGLLCDDRAGGDEQAALEHAPDHELAFCGTAFLDHPQGRRDAAALHELDVESIEMPGDALDVIFRDAAFIREDRQSELASMKPGIVFWREGLLEKVTPSCASCSVRAGRSASFQAQLASTAAKAELAARTMRMDCRSVAASDLILIRGKLRSSSSFSTSSSPVESPIVAKLVTGLGRRGVGHLAHALTARFSQPIPKGEIEGALGGPRRLEQWPEIGPSLLNIGDTGNAQRFERFAGVRKL